MSCIVCFLEDAFQARLRNIARLKGDRFEDALKEYKKLFLAEFDALLGVSSCSKHRAVSDVTQKWCMDLHSSLKKIGDIPLWFDRIRDIYVNWVGGDFVKSLVLLGEMLDERNVLEEEKDGAEYIFCMRGRKSQSALSIQDLYHIPFNRRHLISNQRFSITGLPLLYLGLSPVDIYYELRSSGADLHDLYFSSFVLKNPSNLTIADFTNRFPHLYSTFKALHNIGSEINFNDANYGVEELCRREFYKFILASVCSFQILERYEGSNFVEEYVIPQLLSERIRQKGFDGISYSSTRVPSKVCYSEEVFHTNKFRENIVIFTKYSETTDYDKNLLDQFEISRPVRFSEMESISLEDVEKLREEIVQLNNVSKKIWNIDILAESTGIKFESNFKKIKIKPKNTEAIYYQEHELGKIHLYLVYQHMLTVRNRLKA